MTKDDDNNEPYSIFSARQKTTIVAITVTSTAMLTALPVNIYYPALNIIKEDLNTTTENINFTVTIYIIAQAIAPAFWSPIADRTGRRPVFLMATMTFLLSNVGLALAPNYPVLLAMRLLQSIGGSPTVAIVCGIIGDISPPSRRGTYFSIVSAVRHVVTTTGPMVGGIVAEKTSWRWIWWIMVISGGVIFALMLFFVPETLRSLVGNGSGYANPTPTQWWRHRKQQRQLAKQRQSGEEGYQSSSAEEEGASSITHIPTQPQRKAINPLKPLLFLKEWDVICALLFGGLMFGTQQCFLVTTSHILASVYHLSVMNVGLCFMTGGAGSLAGALSNGRIMDYEFKRVALEACGHVPKRGYLSSEFPIFKARLRYPLCLAAILEASLMVFGWSVFTVQPLPITLTIVFIFCFAHASIFSSIQVLMVDLFPADSSSITATNNLVRCTLAAIGTATVDLGIRAIGIQWTCFALSMILVVSNILPIALILYGTRWRSRRMEKESSLCKEKNKA